MAPIAEPIDTVDQSGDVQPRHLGPLPAAEHDEEQFGGPLDHVFTGAAGDSSAEATGSCRLLVDLARLRFPEFSRKQVTW